MKNERRIDVSNLKTRLSNFLKNRLIEFCKDNDLTMEKVEIELIQKVKPNIIGSCEVKVTYEK
jgi:hypothetical protein